MATMCSGVRFTNHAKERMERRNVQLRYIDLLLKYSSDQEFAGGQCERRTLNHRGWLDMWEDGIDVEDANCVRNLAIIISERAIVTVYWLSETDAARIAA